MGLLHHAAAQADEQFRPGFFQVGQLPHVAEHLYFRVFPDSAGIIKNEVGVGGGFGEAESHFRQHAHELFPVGSVLLAAVAVDQGQQRMVLPEALPQQLRAFPGEFLLFYKLLRRQDARGGGIILGQIGTSESEFISRQS